MSEKMPVNAKKPPSAGEPDSSTLSVGIRSRLEASLLPYLQLMRLDRPNGYWYFWFPHVSGTLLASIRSQSSAVTLLTSNLLLLWGVLVMRGATCTWNDTCDVDYDRQVSRCRNRPLARGAVSVTQANIFTLAQIALCVGTLAAMPPLCNLYALPAVLGWYAYPLAKRVTYYPQVVLGFPMAWGVFMGAAAMGADPLHLAPLRHAFQVMLRARPHSPDAPTFAAALAQISPDPATVSLYVANVLWTLCYELVYSHQDAAEDAAAGVKSLILLYYNPSPDVPPTERFGTKPLLAKLAAGMVICLVLAGRLGHLGLSWEILGVGGCAAGLAAMITMVKLEEPLSCAWWFKVGNVSKYLDRNQG
ncbi:MAG: hypothetical protein M1822_000969 [Bathelium mastoideum]|nr:MAG: hypothetical protein M1822_000969 [Bathelium mastoideum]